MAMGGGDEGWALVPKPVKAQEQEEVLDPTIWVVFAKNLGEEQFMVRFPVDPDYWMGGNGELEISAEKLGEVFDLTVRKLEGNEGKEGGSTQFLDGKWVHEHIAHSKHYQYHFRTISDQEISPNHKDFINSFSFFS